MVLLNSHRDPSKSLKLTNSQAKDLIKLGFSDDPISMNKLIKKFIESFGKKKSFTLYKFLEEMMSITMNYK